MATSQNKQRRRWLRLNLRTLMILVTIICVAMGWYLNRVIRQRRAVAYLRGRDATVVYNGFDDDPFSNNPFSSIAVAIGGEDPFADDPFGADPFGNSTSTEGQQQPPRKSIKQWVIETLGVDFFYNVTEVNLDLASQKDMQAIANFPRLESLAILMSQSEEPSLNEIRGLTHLKSLVSIDFEVRNIDALSRMRRLETLGISSSRLENIDGLTGLRNLRTLSIPGSKVADLSPLRSATRLNSLRAGGTPIEDLSPLARLTEMETLELDATKVRDLAPLEGLTKLSYLSLGSTDVSDLRPLAKMSDLRTLLLSHTKTRDISPLKDLRKLSTLLLVGCKVGSIEPLRDMEEMEYLKIGGSQSITNLDPLSKLTKINDLEIDGVGSIDLQALGNLSQCQTLKLSNMPVSDLSPIGKMSLLWDLALDKLDAIDVDPIARLPQLRMLSIRDTVIKDDPVVLFDGNLNRLTLCNASIGSLDWIGTGVSVMQSLDLSHNPFSDLGGIQRLNVLESLNVSSTELIDLAPVASLQSLQRIAFDDTQVSDLKPLTQKSLTEIHANRTKVTEATALASCTNLEYLYLSGTPIRSLDGMERLKNLWHLDISKTQVTDLTPLYSLPQLKILNLTGVEIPEEQIKKIKELIPGLRVTVDELDSEAQGLSEEWTHQDRFSGCSIF
ncbi:MAG: hypothetical protein KDB00_20915 [Planctomycetales bacterium]|nr:hypothetical protein [Planctomycetales bacterium]